MVENSGKKILGRSGPVERLGQLRLCFSDLGIDALLVTHLPNIRYLCEFTGSAGLLLVDGSAATLFTDSRYTFQAREEVTGARVRIAKRGVLRSVSEALRARRGRFRLGYSASQVTVAQKQALESAVGRRIRWVNDANAVEKLRAVKDEDELARMRASASLISEAFIRVLPVVKPGVTELHLAAEIEYVIKELGASGTSFESIVASGTRSAWAHARPTSKPLRKSELVVFDQGAILRGYCSDMTRTVVLGRGSRKARSLYSAVLEAEQAAKEAIRPDVTAGDVDLAARRVLKRLRLAQYFTHSTGHGLGLEIHEMPRLGKDEKTVLRKGMVVTVEPGVYIEGFGGIRIEDEVVVTATGSTDLTTAPRDFLEL